MSACHVIGMADVRGERFRVIAMEVLGLQVEASSGTPVVLLQEEVEPYRVLPIFIGGAEAASIAVGLSGTVPERPLTHDLLATVLGELHTDLDRVLLTELREGTFYAELELSGPTGRLRVSSRPSDAVAVAVRTGTPVYAAEHVLDEAGVIPEVLEVDEAEALSAGEPEVDVADIDEAVEEFRSFLDELDPSDFGEPGDESPN